MRKFIILLGLIPFTLHANTIPCPKPDIVLAQRLVSAIQNPHDETQWNFRSSHFTNDNKVWYVEFGSFFEGNLSQAQALIQGQSYFDKVGLQIPFPKAVRLGRQLLCDYMPTGASYWVSALTYN